MKPCQHFKQKEWHISNSKLNEIPHSSVYLPDASGIWRAVSMAYCQCQRVKVYMRFQVPMAVSMMFRVFWDVAPCSHVEVDQCFRGAYCLHHQKTSQKTL
jgi:hypothetical protein